MVNHPFHLVLATALTFTVTVPQTIAAGVDDLSFSPTPEETLVSLKFPQAGDRGTTQSSGGGGTRGGSCFTQANTNLRIVAPSQDTFTATANPSLFVYVPANRGVEGEFVLVDGAGELIHSQTVAVPSGETILAIAVPPAVGLEPGGEYAWAFAVNCTLDNQVVGSAVEAGLVRRELSVEVTEEIEGTDEPLSKANLYANQGIWQDTLMIVASLSEQREELVELLGSVGLAQFSDVPIVFVGTDETGAVPLTN